MFFYHVLRVEPVGSFTGAMRSLGSAAGFDRLELAFGWGPRSGQGAQESLNQAWADGDGVVAAAATATTATATTILSAKTTKTTVTTTFAYTATATVTITTTAATKTATTTSAATSAATTTAFTTAFTTAITASTTTVSTATTGSAYTITAAIAATITGVGDRLKVELLVTLALAEGGRGARGVVWGCGAAGAFCGCQWATEKVPWGARGVIGTVERPVYNSAPVLGLGESQTLSAQAGGFVGEGVGVLVATETDVGREPAYPDLARGSGEPVFRPNGLH